MAQRRTQLNVNIDPKLLLRIKSEAIKNGMTLTEFVTSKLSKIDSISKVDVLEERLSKIEEHLNLNKKSSDKDIEIGAIFTDQGAKEYGEVAKRLFDLHLKKKGISKEKGLKELTVLLEKLPHSFPELIFQILLGHHDLTGSEMTIAYRSGSCGMRTALMEWSNDPLEDLNETFLNAVVTKSLV